MATKKILGDWPIEIGLWVGAAATPNRLGKKGDGRTDTAVARVRPFRRDGREAPAPIKACPWCGEPFTRDSFACHPNDLAPKNMVIRCAGPTCAFTGARALPILTVDEAIYRRLPAFVIATVDKFAGLPWLAEAGAFFGNVDREDEWGFYGAADPGQGRRLFGGASLCRRRSSFRTSCISSAGRSAPSPRSMRPSSIDLATRHREGKTIRPKVVASTATVRRAAAQIEALFDRKQTEVFPAARSRPARQLLRQDRPVDREAGAALRRARLAGKGAEADLPAGAALAARGRAKGSGLRRRSRPLPLGALLLQRAPRTRRRAHGSSRTRSR